MNKRRLSEKVNALLGLNDDPIDFSPMSKSDLERLLPILEGRGGPEKRGLLPLKVTVETSRPSRPRPLLSLVERVLGER